MKLVDNESKGKIRYLKFYLKKRIIKNIFMGKYLTHDTMKGAGT